MTKSDNIYIDALKLGVDKMPNGVSRDELMEHLRKIGWEFNQIQEQYLTRWFFTNYYYNHAYNILKQGNPSQIASAQKDMDQHWNKISCYLTAEAYSTYVDYQVLQSTRKSTKQARNISLIAIIISASFALIQILLEVFSNC